MIRRIVITIVFLTLFTMPTGALAMENIRQFDADIFLNQDGSVSVIENILYDFNEEERHGIYRDITYKYKARGGAYKLRISDVSVTDELGNKYNFESSYFSDYFRIKVGDAGKIVSGKHWYKISYVVRRAINYFKDHDEFYWNVTGNGWHVPIGQVRATVYLPGNFNQAQVQKICYYGPLGSTAECSVSSLEINERGQSVVFSASGLDPAEGLTAVVGVPAGTIAKPPLAMLLYEILKDNGVLILPLIVFAWLFMRWKKYGKDSKGRGTIIPEYEAPVGMTPAEVGAMIDGRADQHDVSAEIIDLAVRGYVKIRRVEEGKLFKSTDYIFVKLKSADGLAKQYDKEIMDGLFGKGSEVKLSDLKYNFSGVMNKVKNMLYQVLTDAGYYVKNPMSVRVKYLVSAGFVFFLSFFIGSFFGLYGFLSMIISAFVIGVFGFLMVAITKSGAEIKEKILGLKMYLSVAEKARIEFHNAPEKNPEQFEKFLPYAMVLKVEKEWAKQFEGIYNTQPKWYEDSSHRGIFNAVLLAGAVSSFDNSASATLGATISSASSGGSGFSGGGSGGGFGGGGGGSW